MTLNRRDTLTLLGGGAMLGATPGLAAAKASPQPGEVTFAHGVASGDPASDGAVIWTRVTPAPDFLGEIELHWHVAATRDGKPVRSGRISARAAADFTAKVEVDGLRHGRDYWYWFTTGGQRSATGQFRTLPIGPTDRLVVAAASCQLYSGGLFNAYADMATLPRLDAVIHLGDYIYEYGSDGYGAEIGQRLGRVADPAHEIVTVDDYRRRHAQVKSDPDLQAAHARAAFICVWDDHETANDAWIGGAQNHDPATEGDWLARKAAAMQAYFEWMPIRDPKPGKPREAINRSFEFGDLATLAMVETRLLARSQQVLSKGATAGPADYGAMLAERERPERELLGQSQLQWLKAVLARSVKSGKPWQVLGNQVVMAKVAGPELDQLPANSPLAVRLANLPAAFQQQIKRMTDGFRAGLPFNFDSWDGYPHARERLYAAFRSAGARPIVLSGDSHAAWANDLYNAQGQLVATEFGATAITSPSYGSILPGLGDLLTSANQEVVFCDQDRKGYVLLNLTPQAAITEFVTVSTVLTKPFERQVVARFTVEPGDKRKTLSA